MILTRADIRQCIDEGTLIFTPSLDGFQNQPHAVDLRLGTKFYIPKVWHLTNKGREIINVDVTESAGDNYDIVELQPGQYFELAPGESIIASTLEKIELHEADLMGVLYPRSSINRRGLAVDMTGIVDAFYAGHLMIPILNKTSSQVIRIYPGERICQIVFHKLTTPLSRDEALLHGAVPAKYDGACDQSLGSKQDALEEMDYIRNGDLEGLKQKSY